MIGLTGATWVESIDQFRYGQAGQVGPPQPFVLGPGAEIPGGAIEISPGHLLATVEGRGAQFLWGWARYRDIFPNSPEHVVEFCFRVTMEGQLRLPPANIRVQFGFHGEHIRYYDA
jgi:hypothetical protein